MSDEIQRWANLAQIVTLVLMLIIWKWPKPDELLRRLRPWLSYLLVAVFFFSSGFYVNSLVPSTTPSSPLPPTLVNLVKRFDFEDGKGGWEVWICNADPCNWFRADSRLNVSRDSFTGKQSLEVLAELVNRGQFYSIQRGFDAPLSADVISANVYVPATKSNPVLPQATGINLWIFPLDAAIPLTGSSFDVSKPGWQRITLDLRRISDTKGNPFNMLPMNSIHIDLVLPAASTETARFLIDDVELFKPTSSQK